MNRTPSMGNEDVVDASSVNIGFNSEQSKANQRGMKGSSLSESRKRIAQAVGRKPST
jgi:hypothetical protein